MPEQAVLDSPDFRSLNAQLRTIRRLPGTNGASTIAAARGPEAQYGREDIARRFEGWFSRATEFEVLETLREPVGHRNRLSWRFRMSRDGQSKEVVAGARTIAFA
jgi:hypothetical protein